MLGKLKIKVQLYTHIKQPQFILSRYFVANNKRSKNK